MKPSQSKQLLADCLKRGWVKDGDVYRTPAEAAALGLNNKQKPSRTKHIKTGWIDDTRNIANKQRQVDLFVHLVKQELQLEVWPEFFFTKERGYRFDYAIPDYKICIEVEGGIWAKGNSGHSSGTGIMRDMQKSSLAAVNGWIFIRRTPDQLVTIETLNLIKTAISQR